MTDHAVILDSLFVVHWSPHFSPDEVRGVITSLTDARRILGHPLVMVAVTDTQASPPADDTLDALLHGLPIFDHVCSCAFGVVAADSPARRLLVGQLEAFRTLSIVPSEICDTLDVALRHAARAIRVEADRVIDAARRTSALGPLLHPARAP